MEIQLDSNYHTAQMIWNKHKSLTVSGRQMIFEMEGIISEAQENQLLDIQAEGKISGLSMTTIFNDKSITTKIKFILLGTE